MLTFVLLGNVNKTILREKENSNSSLTYTPKRHQQKICRYFNKNFLDHTDTQSCPELESDPNANANLDRPITPTPSSGTHDDETNTNPVTNPATQNSNENLDRPNTPSPSSGSGDDHTQTNPNPVPPRCDSPKPGCSKSLTMAEDRVDVSQYRTFSKFLRITNNM